MSNPYLVCSDRELRTLPTQWLLAERWEKAINLLHDLHFAEAKTGRVGIDELLQDHTTALRLLPKDNGWFEKLKATNRVLDLQAHRLRNWNPQEQPAYFLQQIRNEAFAQDLNQWQAQAEAQLSCLKEPYLIERFPNRSDPAELRTLAGHSKNVISLALSADGRLAVSTSNDRTIKVWDVATGRELRLLTEHSDMLAKVALSADGQLAVSTSGNTLKVWDVASGRELRTFADHSKTGDGLRTPIGQLIRIDDIALSMNGLLAISTSDKCIKVWDILTGRELRTLIGYSRVTRVALNGDGRLAVSASIDRTIKVWDVTSGDEVCTLIGHSDSVYSVVLSAGGQLAVSASKDGTIKVWDIPNRRELCTLTGHSDSVYSVVLSADGQLAVSASKDGTIKVWDIPNRRELCTLTGHSSEVSGIALSADGRLAISSAPLDNIIKVWDIMAAVDADKEYGRAQDILPGHRASVGSVALSGNGQLAVSASKDGSLKVWDVSVGRELRTLTGHDVEVNSVALSTDGQLAVSASSDQTIKVWDVLTGHELNTLTGHSAAVKCASLSADGRLAVSASYDNTLKVWDVPTGCELHTLTGYDTGEVSRVALSANGRLAVSASSNHEKLWDIPTGRELHAFTIHGDTMEGLTLSTNGRLVISESWNKTLNEWGDPTGHEQHTIKRLIYEANGAAVSADGKLAVSALEYEIKVWDVSSGCSIATLLLGTSLNCCAMSENGKTIVAGDERGWVHFFELVGTDELLAEDLEINKSWLALQNETVQTMHLQRIGRRI